MKIMTAYWVSDNDGWRKGTWMAAVLVSIHNECQFVKYTFIGAFHLAFAVLYILIIV